jgi:predicted transcriptional regulator
MVPEKALSRRETEVMEILHRLARATAAEVRDTMEQPPTDAAVRSVLRILVEKGHVAFFRSGPRYIYSPTVSAQAARRNALTRMLSTFFEGSTEGAMAALLQSGGPLTADSKRRLKGLIDRAEEEGR